MPRIYDKQRDFKFKKNNRIDYSRCVNCGHNKKWLNRGDMDPQYITKCCKCGHMA